MTIDELIDALREVRGGWTVDSGGFLRHRVTHDCPLTALANVVRDRGDRDRYLDRYSPSKVGRAAADLGLRSEDAEAVVAAADGHDGHDRCLRSRLLRALRAKIERGSV